MEIDPLKEKAEALRALTTGPLSYSVAKISGSSRGIPSEKDFHFYYNFDEFKVPMKDIAEKSKSILDTVGTSMSLWGKEMVFPEDFDDAYDWLVNVNDEVLERFDVSVDEFRSARKKEEELGVRVMSPMAVDSENGFQLVYGKKKKGLMSQAVERDGGENTSLASSVKVASRDKKTVGTTKPKVPFHIPTITRPQDEYKILVNNSNQSFEHVWLQRSEDGSRFIHPLEKFSAMDFVDNTVGDVEPVIPSPLECTPFKLVEEVKDLKVLAAKLQSVSEFAVDLEHNQYRSFQGLTCLMQISTRTEDFVLDTLKLRIHIGPYLRDLFKDPTKKKVMHGADRDIMWLQRDFGIYVCNLFDTGQASKVLKLERNSLEYLLQHFCDVKANKEYQNADWRLRPLPLEMLRYAREDTHYLLYIHDLMKIRLYSLSTEAVSSDTPLVEVYKHSYDICLQLYEKEILTESSYLFIYGVRGADLNAQQLAIVAGLCEWRDVVARAEDESTGYILPNKTLIEIAKQMPLTANKLRRLLKSKHSYVERNLNSVVSIIRHSMQNAAAFEAAVEQLKEGQMETVSVENVVVTDASETLSAESPAISKVSTVEGTVGNNATNGSIFGQLPTRVQFKERYMGLECNTAEEGRKQQDGCSAHPAERRDVKIASGQIRDRDANMSVSHSGTGATVQVLKKPGCAFGALLGNSATKRKFDPDKKEKDEIKLEQIKSSVNLGFHSFSGKKENVEMVVKEAAEPFENPQHREAVVNVATTSNLDIILLDSDSDAEKSVNGNSQAANDDNLENKEGHAAGHGSEMEGHATGHGSEMEGQADVTMSLSDLSSSFQKCFQSVNHTRKTKKVGKCEGLLQFKPFDYEAARTQVRFGEDAVVEMGAEGDENRRSRLDAGDKKKKSVTGQSENEGTREFPQGRRRQAFPASGNRSATFR